MAREAGHPAAGELARALTEFAASGEPRSIDQGIQLKVTLKHSNPAIWRSVRLPVTVTLGDLHWVIQILFGWDGDHLHAFRVGGRVYSDLDFALDDTADEDDIRIRDACRPGVKAGYEYDLGTSWQHEIPLCSSYWADSATACRSSSYSSVDSPRRDPPLRSDFEPAGQLLRSAFAERDLASFRANRGSAIRSTDLRQTVH